ncbi:carboxylesterase family protein [Arcticibacterium luteifluviistationis]|uniref:Phospholipase n=1 Tax=Arcticibacterium luteifluviistationis TaxID=1784714 RepID=A0A2Z4GBR4_9BACT|nr:hypothetical protein [Arcticibacterium luteifluviistationis]AWV98571.1 hypothetical protein DJ013_10480 [Arcticibacterium luteifluviistationis]
MNNSFISLVCFILLFSCKKESETVVKNRLTEEVFVPSTKIDSSDLVGLPKDTGGVHKGYLLNKTEAIYAHMVYTPGGYQEEGQGYPLLIFLHGWGPRQLTNEIGTDLNVVKEHGPPALIEQNQWNPSFPFIVASPQLEGQYWASADIHSFIDYIIGKYNINTKRIYLTGLSLGGGGCWYYVGEKGDESHAAAIIPISARGEASIVSNLTNTPIWAFHGAKDQTVEPINNYGSVMMVDEINRNSPAVIAKVTVFDNAGHDAWTRTYGNQFGETGISYSPFNLNIYDWLLQYKKE